MKKTPPKPPQTSDTLCKRLAEQHPEAFARWLFDVRGEIKVIKTELDREPVRADAITLAHDTSEMLHAEFQSSAQSKVPLPLRMLDYYVGLKRQNPLLRIRQVVVVLKPSRTPTPNRFEDERTSHSYEVVELWRQDPSELLKHEGLLPLATLCRTDKPEQLLKNVAARIRRIKSPVRRRETLDWSRMLAGLRYDTNLIYQTLKESNMLEESTVYQDILQKGEQRGAQRLGQSIALGLLEQRFGKTTPTLRRKIERLASEQIEDLCLALRNFQSRNDLSAWLKQQPAKS